MSELSQSENVAKFKAKYEHNLAGRSFFLFVYIHMGLPSMPQLKACLIYLKIGTKMNKDSTEVDSTRIQLNRWLRHLRISGKGEHKTE